ncbi:MAG: hypothetical protein E7672_06500 [Ruminococcaceae bacterium]|nr:hypothetical protein [Oscillospiraceae bacterium]
MNLRKIFTGFLSFALAASVLTVDAGAMKLIGSANIYSKLGIESKIVAGTTLSTEDAAMRLYHLDMISGSGTDINGSIKFDLDRGLNRVEAAVFAVRLLGEEKTVEAQVFTHPFTDVPEWATNYVGYIYSCGLISDIKGEYFDPSAAETTERFMSYMLYALGYRMKSGDYTYYMAAEYARDAGICVTERDEPLTRGGAVMAMYNTLRATMKNSKRVYSDKLVEKGVISYQDAIFLLWTVDKEETNNYMDAMGYSAQWVIPNGYYRIKSSADTNMLLNVAVDGVNRDYEGVPVTLWQDTGDVSQTFRIERTPRGTYYIYSAASKNGYGRVIGNGYPGASAGLYSAYGNYATEFYIEPMADGSWYIAPSYDSTMCLTYNGQMRNAAAVTVTERENTQAGTWIFERQGTMNSSGEELAIYPAKSLWVTQGAYDTYSHQTQNAIDVITIEGAVFAPFNAKIVRIDAYYYACNAVWIESTSKVRYADGSYDYMTALFMHDNYIGDLYVGQALTQGEYFYQQGDYGVSSGKHVHLAFYRGRYHSGMRLGSGNIFAEDAVFLSDDTYIYNGYGLEWNVTSRAD